MTTTLKVAAVQLDVQLADVALNLQRMKSKLDEVDQDIFLCAFPECSLTGYCFESIDEAREASLELDHHAITTIRDWAASSKTNLVFGFLEMDNDDVFNSAALATTKGDLFTYRKVHLPFLGVDRFTTPGQRPFGVHEIDGVRVGMNICYDCSFPESSRMLSLRGADLIVLPTNWPPGSGSTADYIPNARALENNVYFMAVNRIGTERGFEFIGKSKICSPDGYDLAFADHADEETLIADIDPAISRKKRLVRVPGKHEIDRFKDRRPDMYEGLLDENEHFE